MLGHDRSALAKELLRFDRCRDDQMGLSEAKITATNDLSHD